MASLVRRVASRLDPALAEERWEGPTGYFGLSWDQYLSYFNFGGALNMLSGLPQTMPGSPEEAPEASFEGYSAFGFRSNSVIFSCLMVRLLTFSEARFRFRQTRSQGPGNLFGTSDLVPLETPWTNATTGDLLARAIQDVDLAGNAYFLRRGQSILRLRPDWVTIVMGSKMDVKNPAWALDAEVIGYTYKPGGTRADTEAVSLLADEVAHFAPIPDPTARFRGESWLHSIIREVMADSAAMRHKLKFFENAATVNHAWSLDPAITAEQFKTWVELFRTQHEGVANAYKTIFVGGGAKPIPLGSTMEQATFKEVQGHGETRIAAAAGVPPILVGLSEGLEAATYSNYGLAKRRFAEMTMRPLWRNICGSLAHLVTVPDNSELWYDDRDVPFLQEDIKDRAAVLQIQMASIKQGIDAGFEPTSVVDAVSSEDLSRLAHSGLVSVQLQPPGSSVPGEASPAQDMMPVSPNGAPPVPAGG